ncbi:MAG: hypothetical protein WBO70_05960 [Erysipelotrichaceae bacterium]
MNKYITDLIQLDLDSQNDISSHIVDKGDLDKLINLNNKKIEEQLWDKAKKDVEAKKLKIRKGNEALENQSRHIIENTNKQLQEQFDSQVDQVVDGLVEKILRI